MIKKLLLILVFIIPVFAGVFTSISGFTAKEIKPDAFYTVDTAGENPRVYVFTVKGSKPLKQCVMVFTESMVKYPTMHCWN